MGRAWNDFVANLMMDKDITDQINRESDILHREMKSAMASQTGPSADEIAEAVVQKQQDAERMRRFNAEFMAKRGIHNAETEAMGIPNPKTQEALKAKDATIAKQAAQIKKLQQTVANMQKQLQAKNEKQAKLEKQILSLEAAVPFAKRYPDVDPSMLVAAMFDSKVLPEVKKEYSQLTRYSGHQGARLGRSQMEATYATQQLETMQENMRVATPDAQTSEQLVQQARTTIDDFKRLQSDYMTTRVRDLPKWIIQERQMIFMRHGKVPFWHDTGVEERQRMAETAGRAAGYVASLPDSVPEKQRLSDELAEAWGHAQEFERTSERAHDELLYNATSPKINETYQGMVSDAKAADDEPGLG